MDGVRQQQLLIDAAAFPDPFVGGAANRAIPTLRRFDEALRPPASLQWRVELERQLPRGWRVSLSSSWSRAWARLRSRNLNAPFGALDASAINGSLARNVGDNPATATLDLNLTRTFGLGKTKADGERQFRLSFNARASNLLNRTNPLGLTGVLSSPFFNRANAAGPARRVRAWRALQL